MPKPVYTKPIPCVDVTKAGIVKSIVEDSPHKLFIGGLPHEFSDIEVKTLLLRYGQLKAFSMP